MKAIVQNGYGSPDFLSLKDVEKPTIQEDEVLVRVKATSINAGDYFSLMGTPWLVRFSVGFPKPKDYILGWDMAGQVEAVGDQVKNYKIGDKVFTACGSAYAEYVKVKETLLALMPENLTYLQAAAVPTAALTALQGLCNVGKVQSGQKVLINGASGGVGTFSVQIAKVFGAEVTGVCSTRNVDMVHSIGADQVVDYTKDDFTKSGKQYDLILDNVANRSLFELKRVATPEGIIIPNSGHGGMGYVIKAFLYSPFMSQLGKMYLSTPNSNDMAVLKEFLEAGKIKPIIDKEFSLENVADAFRYLAEKHAQGKIVINVE